MRQLILIIAVCTGVLWGGPVGADEADDAYDRGHFGTASLTFKWPSKRAVFFDGRIIRMSESSQVIPVAAPIDTDSAGRGGEIATQSVVRIICREQNSSGTGFLHKSGKLITAEHVVHGCPNPLALLPTSANVQTSVVGIDADLDLALLEPKTSINADALSISAIDQFTVGTQVTTWGFPGGYTGSLPMLSVGYLAGIDGLRTATGKVIRRWVVNAAFNAGNSGGPLIHVETGEVMGVVSSKLAPISASTMSALKALENQKSGFMYTVTKPDGTTFQMSEGQVVETILNELRQQVQLVIGQAVLLEDLKAFLRANSIEP